jgi:hypothetical protein
MDGLCRCADGKNSGLWMSICKAGEIYGHAYLMDREVLVRVKCEVEGVEREKGGGGDEERFYS